MKKLKRIKIRDLDSNSIHPTSKWKIKNSIWIPGNVISSKNSRVNITIKNSKFRPSVLSSAGRKYITKSKSDWANKAIVFRTLVNKIQPSQPIYIQMIFVRENRIRFDYHNMVQLPADLMQDYGWIENDDHESLVILNPPITLYDKENPGLFIKVLEEREIELFKSITPELYG